MKKKYMKPQMEAMKMQQTTMICNSHGAKSLSIPGGEGLTMPETPGGILGNDDDDI